MTTVKDHAEVVVVGGGSSGAVVAGRLAEAGVEVLLIEAGPDYGHFDDGRWPAEILDAALIRIEETPPDVWTLIIDHATPFPVGDYPMFVDVTVGESTCSSALALAVIEYVAEGG